jgi:hypothetical protein
MKKPVTRRSFISKTASFCGISIVCNVAMGQPTLNENSPKALSLRYKTDATTVNAVKFPRYSSGQRCGNCALFQGKAGDVSGRCSLVVGDQVSAFGWCDSYVRKGGFSESIESPELSKPQSIENQNGSNSQPSITTKAQANESERLSLDVSKQKCEELGFKPATEAFGKCVLQLTK